MHPILSRHWIRLYLAAWAPVGALLAVLAGLTSGRRWPEAAALALPLALFYAFVCLGSWSLCRALPLGRTGLPRLVLSHGAAGLLSSSLWLIFGMGWAALLARAAGDPAVLDRYENDLPLFFAFGTFLFLLAASVHYLLIAFEASRTAMFVAVRTADLAIVSPIESLRRDEVLGTGDD